jgi:hypothetical protein
VRNGTILVARVVTHEEVAAVPTPVQLLIGAENALPDQIAPRVLAFCPTRDAGERVEGRP